MLIRFVPFHELFLDGTEGGRIRRSTEPEQRRTRPDAVATTQQPHLLVFGDQSLKPTQVIPPPASSQMIQPPNLARQVYGTRRTGIARGGRTQHQGADEAVVLPNLGLLGEYDDLPRQSAVVRRDAFPAPILPRRTAVKFAGDLVAFGHGLERRREQQRRWLDPHGIPLPVVVPSIVVALAALQYLSVAGHHTVRRIQYVFGIHRHHHLHHDLVQQIQRLLRPSLGGRMRQIKRVLRDDVKGSTGI